MIDVPPPETIEDFKSAVQALWTTAADKHGIPLLDLSKALYEAGRYVRDAEWARHQIGGS